MSWSSRLLCVAVLVTTGFAGATVSTAAQPQETAPVAVSTPETLETTEEGRILERELDELADAWADGGGRFGYPYWDKAGHRWRSGEISTSLFREYVTSYRDRLVEGCELLESVNTSGAVADEVRDLVVNSCSRRVDGLRAQQRWLDELIRRDSGATDDAPEVVDERLAEREADANEAFQESWRDARLAMDLAQSELDSQAAELLPEDAFI